MSTGRTRADEALAAALAAGMTVKDAAGAAAVSETTAYARLKLPAFAGRVAELRGQMVATAAGKLADSMGQAIDVLRALLGSQSEGIRLRAADRLIELGIKVKELLELQKRVEDIERQLSGAKT